MYRSVLNSAVARLIRWRSAQAYHLHLPFFRGYYNLGVTDFCFLENFTRHLLIGTYRVDWQNTAGIRTFPCPMMNASGTTPDWCT